MRTHSRRSRNSVLVVAVVMAMWSVQADAQTTASEGQELPRSSASHTGPTTDGPRDYARPEMHAQFALDERDAIARAQSTTQTTRRDSVLTGVLIGAGIGALLGLIPDYYDDCEECHDSLYASIAVGAGIGLIVDLLRSDTRTASRSRSDDRFRVRIAGGRRGVGVRGILRWQ
jgi:hypothetical protein